MKDDETEDGSDGQSGPSQPPGHRESGKAEAELDVVVQSGSQKAIENLLKVYYEPLEIWFLRTSIEKVSRQP